MPFTKISGDSGKNPLVHMCGNVNREEFRDIVSCLKSHDHGVPFILNCSPALNDFLALPKPEREQVDMFFFLQETPDEYPQAALLNVRRECPLAIIVVILGALCEGMGRTKSPVNGCIRFYWHQWPTFGHSQFVAFIARKAGYYTLPPTTTEADAVSQGSSQDDSSLLARMTNTLHDPHCRQGTDVIVVSADDSAVAKMIIDFANASYSRARRLTLDEVLDESTPPARVIIDSNDLEDAVFYQKVESISHSFPLVPIDILAFSPRPREVRRYSALNNCVVFPKPFI